MALFSISLTVCVHTQNFIPVRCSLFFLKAVFKGGKAKLFFKDYLNLSVIYGSPLALEEIASHPHEKKTTYWKE